MNNMDDLRLEIETLDNPDNVIANSDAELGTWGWYREDHKWIDLFSNKNAQETTDRNYKRNAEEPFYYSTTDTLFVLSKNFVSDPNSPLDALPNSMETKVWTEPAGVKPGQYVRASAFATSAAPNLYIRLGHQFINAAGSIVSTHWTAWWNGLDTATNTSGVLKTIRSTPSAAPATAVRVRMIVQGAYSGDGVTFTPLNHTQHVDWRRAELLVQDSSTFGTTFVPSVLYRNILTNTTSMNIKRAEMEAGILTATVRDATVDPAQAAGIRPGKRVRVQSLVNGAWGNIFAGTLNAAKTVYNKDGKATITLTAIDAMSDMVSTPAEYAPDHIDQLPAVLEASGVPYNVNNSDATGSNLPRLGDVGGTSPYAATERYKYVSDSLSVLDAVAMARDTRKAYAWVDRDGLLNVFDTAHRPGGTRVSLTDKNASTVTTRTNLDPNPQVLSGGPTSGDWTFLGPVGTMYNYDTFGGVEIAAPAGWNSGSSNITVKPPVAVDPTPGTETSVPWLVSLDCRGGTSDLNLAAEFRLRYRRSGETVDKYTDWRSTGGGTNRHRFGFHIAISAGSLEWWIEIRANRSGASLPSEQYVAIIERILVQKKPLSEFAGGVGDTFAYTNPDDGNTQYLRYDEGEGPKVGLWVGHYFDGSKANATWAGTAKFSRSVEAYSAFSYSDIDAGFDTNALFNVINLKTLHTEYVDEQVTVVQDNGETVTFTASVPKTRETVRRYSDEPSINEWGARNLDRTILSPLVLQYSRNADGTIAEGTQRWSYRPETWAAEVLAKSSAPTVTVNALSFPVKTTNSRVGASTVDLYSPAFVAYQEVLKGDYIVTGIEHTIKPGKWVCTLSFNKKVDSALW